MENKSSSLPYYVGMFITILFGLGAIYLLLKHPEEFWDRNVYSGFAPADWLINYQGGFVRRGFIGEILFRIFQVRPYDVRTVILCVEMTSYILFLILIISVFQKKRWSLLAVLIPLVLGTEGFQFTLTDYRRDFLMMILCYYVFTFFTEYLRTGTRARLAVAVLLMDLGIIIYEPFFFFVVPISCIIMFLCWDGSWQKKTLNMVRIFSSPAMVMGAVCVFRGSFITAEKIWHSWYPLFMQFPESTGIPSIPPAIDFLQKETADVMLFHLQVNFVPWSTFSEWPGEHYGMLVYNACFILMFVLLYYFVTQTHTYDVKLKRIRTNDNHIELSSILILQFFFMLPLFTILSCDHGRNILFWIVSTFFLVYCMEKNGIKVYIPMITAISKSIQGAISSSRLLRSPWLYYILIPFVPIAGAFSPCYNQTLAYHFIHLIMNIVGR